MTATDELRKKVEEQLDKIRPNLQADGGDVSLVDIEDGVVKVSLEGACKGCPMSSITLQMGIERVIKNEIPEIKAVEAVNLNLPQSFFDRLRQKEEN